MNQLHPTSAEIEAHARRELEPAAALRVSDHLAGCDLCRKYFLGARKAVRSARETDAVSAEELTAWVRDELEPMERYSVAQSLARSRTAQAELLDLENFAAEMRRDFARAPHREIPRWILPLAAAVLVSAGALWWKTNTSSSDSWALRDGGRRIELRSLPLELQRSATAALTKGVLEVPEALRALQSKRSVLAGEAAKESGFHLLTPMGTAVEDGLPVFRWSAYPSATGYRVVVVAIDNDALVTTVEIPAGQLSWKPDRPLTREKIYQWEVEAVRGDDVLAKAPNPPEPDARFRVISQRDADELEQIRAKSPGGHLAMGLAYARAGLIAQANEEFQALGKENPESPIPENLRAALGAGLRALEH